MYYIFLFSTFLLKVRGTCSQGLSTAWSTVWKFLVLSTQSVVDEEARTQGCKGLKTHGGSVGDGGTRAREARRSGHQPSCLSAKRLDSAGRVTVWFCVYLLDALLGPLRLRSEEAQRQPHLPSRRGERPESARGTGPNRPESLGAIDGLLARKALTDRGFVAAAEWN